MKCQTCKVEEIDPNAPIFGWTTDEHGAPVQISICKRCSETTEEEKFAAQRAEAKVKAKDAKITRNLSRVYVSTTDKIPTKDVVEFLGPVRGSTVRAKHIGRDIGAGLKNIVGGEIVGYTELLSEAREEALHRMKLDAEGLGANAVIGFRFSTSTIDAGVAEITAYGTAVKIKESSGAE